MIQNNLERVWKHLPLLRISKHRYLVRLSIQQVDAMQILPIVASCFRWSDEVKIRLIATEWISIGIQHNWKEKEIERCQPIWSPIAQYVRRGHHHSHHCRKSDP